VDSRFDARTVTPVNARQSARRCTIEAVASWENLHQAAARARRGKSRREDVEAWWVRRESHLARLRRDLLGGAWQPGPYHFFEVFEPKRRLIAAAPFADRVVHHALCLRLAPVLERRFIARSFSCQAGKGTTAARECCRRLVNRHRYVLKCDVRKFFPTIDHAILMGKLDALVGCAAVGRLIRSILASYRTGSAAGNGGHRHLLEAADPGARAMAPGPRGPSGVHCGQNARGLPIGNLTSQLWANFYLDGLDHWVTETERCGAYLRYTDDFLLFGDDKPRLWELREGIGAQLASLRLQLAEPKSRVLATAEGVPFLGFRFLPGLRPRILGDTKRRFEARRYRLHARHDLPRLSRAVYGWYQFSREANSEGLRRAYAAWPLEARLKRRRRKHRVLRGGSWNNDSPDNLSALNRNHNHPDNRNDNNGFRCGVGLGVSPKAGPACAECGAMPGGHPLPGQSQEASLTAGPAPAPSAGKDAARAVAGNLPLAGENHRPQPPQQLELQFDGPARVAAAEPRSPKMPRATADGLPVTRMDGQSRPAHP
jgi:retron-type reverse transcriptase